MVRVSIGTLVCLFGITGLYAQSFELMTGTKRMFVDVQWLKTFDQDRKWSLFSRTRATVEGKEDTNLFSGAYLNYTTSGGFGTTVLGRIASTNAGSDAGIHFFKANETFLVYALGSVALQSSLSYSWFSILRITPEINEWCRLYTSLELFSNFNKAGQVASVQRVRAGISRNNYQFGIAVNLAEVGRSFMDQDVNPGVFVRKEF